MKSVFTILLFLTSIISALLRIYYLNVTKEKAFDAFEEKQYQKAIDEYHYLIDSLEYNNSRAKLNLSHSYYLSNDTANVINSYLTIASDSDKVVRSLTHQQLGVVNTNKEDLKTALAYFKKALKANPYNDEARFNYELIKKRLENQQQKDDQNKDNQKQDKKDQEKKDEQQKDQNKKDNKDGDQQKKDPQEKGDKGDPKNEDPQKQEGEKKGEEGKESEKKEQQDKKDKGEGKERKDSKKQDKEKDKKGDQPSLTPEEQKKKEEMERQQAQMQRFKNVEMSEEKAQMILNAMRQSEKQYLQQLKKQPTKSQESDKPDW